MREFFRSPLSVALLFSYQFLKGNIFLDTSLRFRFKSHYLRLWVVLNRIFSIPLKFQNICITRSQIIFIRLLLNILMRDSKKIRTF